MRLTEWGNRNKFIKGVTDNDGLWTTSSILAQAYRKIAAVRSGNKEAAEDARHIGFRGFEGLEMSSIQTPAYPNYVARSFCKISDGDSVLIPAYNGSFVVKLYKFNKPRYIPIL